MATRGRRTHRETVGALLREHPTNYAEAAGITLRDKPAPLYQLLVLTTLSSARISADIAAASARELLSEGWRTPRRMLDATWQQRVDALGRGGYRRYDESTSAKLEESARWLLETYRGDLRSLRSDDIDGAAENADELAGAISEAPRVGPVGARIFVREVQGLWPEVAPYFDQRALEHAARLGLPTDPKRLAGLAPDGQVHRLSSALAVDSLGSK